MTKCKRYCSLRLHYIHFVYFMHMYSSDERIKIQSSITIGVQYRFALYPRTFFTFLLCRCIRFSLYNFITWWSWKCIYIVYLCEKKNNNKKFQYFTIIIWTMPLSLLLPDSPNEAILWNCFRWLNLEIKLCFHQNDRYLAKILSKNLVFSSSQ